MLTILFLDLPDETATIYMVDRLSGRPVLSFYRDPTARNCRQEQRIGIIPRYYTDYDHGGLAHGTVSTSISRLRPDVALSYRTILPASMRCFGNETGTGKREVRLLLILLQKQ